MQVDLLARDPRGLLTLVEVKMPSHLMRLGRRQRRRLGLAAEALAAFEPVQLVLATRQAGRLLVLPLD